MTIELQQIKEKAIELANLVSLDAAVAYMITNYKMNEYLMDYGILLVEQGDFHGVINWIKGFRE